MTGEFKNAVTRTIADFLREIGIEVIPVSISAKSFLPGIVVERLTIRTGSRPLIRQSSLLSDSFILMRSACRPAFRVARFESANASA